MSQADLSQLKIDRSALPPKKRLRFKPWWLLLVVALLAVGFVFKGMGAAVPVETAMVTTAYPYQALTQLNATGYVVAQRKASVASKATGRLEWLGVVEGSVVKKDEVIARLESKDVRATAAQAGANVSVARAGVAQAEAELVDATAHHKRSAELVAKKFLSPSAMDQAQARLNKAKAALISASAAAQAASAAARVAEVNAEQTVIRAPFDGVVLTKAANVGDTITPFSAALDTKGAVVTIADMSTLEVEADVSESNLQKIHVGQACEIQLDAFPELRFQGEVSRLVPTVDRAKATVMTKVKFLAPDARILPEMSAKVAFLSKAAAEDQRKPLTAVNAAALAQRDGKPVLFVVTGEGDKLAVKQVSVQTGEKLGDNVAVSGVNPGDRVVLKPADKLGDGSAVKLLQK